MKLSTALTMTLLLGSTLNAAALEITDGQLTPRAAAHAWIAEKASGKNPSKSPSSIHEALRTAANAAKTEGNPKLMIDLWRTQQAFTKESKQPPMESGFVSRIIEPLNVHEALCAAAATAKKLEIHNS